MIHKLRALTLGLGISLILGSASISFAQHEHGAGPAKAESEKTETKAEDKGCCPGETKASTTVQEKKDHCGMETADKGVCPVTGAKIAKAPAAAEAAKGKTTAADKKASEIKELGNADCPITGEKVGSMQKGAHVDYKGTRVGLCCSGCSKKFLKDPEAGLKKAKESVAKAS